MSPATGTYRGRKVVNLSAKIEKRAKKTKEAENAR